MPVDDSFLDQDAAALTAETVWCHGSSTAAVDIVAPCPPADDGRLAGTSPPRADPRVALLLVHGGSWYRGDRAMYRRQQHALAAAGHVVGSAGYTLAADSRLADKLADLRLGYRTFRAVLADRWPGVRTVVVGGGSAGGHLAALLALDRDTLGDSPPPDGVVTVYGPGRLARWAPAAGIRSDMLRLCGVAGDTEPAAVEAALEAASPDRLLRPDCPPFLIAQASDDATFPADVVSGWSTALAQHGSTVTVRVYPGTGHGFMINGSEAGRALLSDVDTFLREVDARHP